MSPEDALETIIWPVLREIGQADPSYATPETALGLLATALQESGLEHRRQLLKDWQTGRLLPIGPAMSFWQFEPIGVKQAAQNGQLCCVDALYRQPPCSLPPRKVRPTRSSWRQLYLCLEHEASDRAACILAASLPRSLGLKWPKIGDEEGCWQTYVRAWKPGKPHRERWTRNYARARRALEAVKGVLQPAPVQV